MIHNEDKSATVEWDHASCIESYVIKVWSPIYTDPHEHSVTPYGNRITQTINELEPCTEYSIQVIYDQQKYRGTIQVVPNLPLTSKQRLRFSTWASY